MSSIQLDRITGPGKQQTQFAGQWYLNGNVTRTNSGDYEFASSSFNLDTNYLNVNASSLLAPGTTFGIKAPVQGIYLIKWNHRGQLQINAQTANTYAVYISGHVLNGISYKPLGTPADVETRPVETDVWITNPLTSTLTPLVHNTVSCIEELKAGDIIAPSIYFQGNNCLTFGNSNVNGKVSTFSIVLLKRTS